jgi:hypothetical protein
MSRAHGAAKPAAESEWIWPARPPKNPRVILRTRAIRIVAALDPARLLEIEAPLGTAHVFFEVRAGEGPTTVTLSGRLSPKTLRRVKATIGEVGIDGVVCAVQAELRQGRKIELAGLTVFPRKRPAVELSD